MRSLRICQTGLGARIYTHHSSISSILYNYALEGSEKMLQSKASKDEFQSIFRPKYEVFETVNGGGGASPSGFATDYPLAPAIKDRREVAAAIELGRLAVALRQRQRMLTALEQRCRVAAALELGRMAAGVEQKRKQEAVNELAKLAAVLEQRRRLAAFFGQMKYE